MSTEMIKITGLKKSYGSLEVLKGIDLTIAEKEVVVIIGPSGSGKSTLLRCMNYLEEPTEGTIVVDGIKLDGEANINEVRKEVGMVFQRFNLFPHMTVLENLVLAPMKVRGIDRKTAEATAMELLGKVGLSDKADSYPDQLSGGQQQRVALARILASDPEVLMLDEPFSALDAFLKEKLQLELLELLSGYDKDILMVTHSRDEIYRFCEHMLIVEDGRQAGFGITKEIFKNPGTPAAAKLTGCKNIEKIERVDDHTMVLPNWNTTVCVKGMIPENTTHIGIRAHYLRLPENGQRENLVECQNGKILDDPFELVVVFEHDVWWKIPKESWQKEYQEKMPQYLAIPEESILYLHG